jgi:lipopolysaccharide biosynthesis glycosyltransferase
MVFFPGSLKVYGLTYSKHEGSWVSNTYARVEPNKIPVVASADDNYAAPLDVMLISVLENTENPERFHFFVIDGGISLQKKECINKDIEKRNSQITFLDINSEIYAGLPNQEHISVAAYYRLSIPELFHSSVNRVIYLDCDLIIKDDLQKLWEFQLDEYAVAAVEDVSTSGYKGIGIAQSDYFNSGVLLMDLQKWREQNIAEKARKLRINDQCSLNSVFNGNWKRLPLRWNQQSSFYRKTPQSIRLLKEEHAEGAIWNPAIIHYIGGRKPWFKPCYHPLEGEYRRYLARSSFASLEIVDRSEEYAKRKNFFWRLKKTFRQRGWQKRYRKKGFQLY